MSVSSQNAKPLKTIITIIVVLWAVFLISSLPLGKTIKAFGIYPRTPFGFFCILTAPLLHANLKHIIANTSTLFVLGIIFFTVERTRAFYIMIPIYVLSGFGVWALGSSGTVYIGASGIIYGLLGYLMSIGFFRKNFITILLSIALFLLYGSALLGMFPRFTPPNVSWLGHLCGFAIGILVARSEARRYR